MAATKVVHLHLKQPLASVPDDIYCSSIKAIYDVVSADDIGIKYSSLLNTLTDKTRYENKRCVIIVSTLRSKPHTHPQNR